MAQYYSDDALQEIHDEMHQKEEERPKSGFSQLTKQTKFIIGISAGIVLLMVMNDKLTTKQGLMFLAVGAIVLYLMTGTSPERKELTMLECMIRINDLLKFLQKHPVGDNPQVPPGEIQLKLIGRKQWYEGKGFKRSFAVDLWDEELDVTEMYFVEVDIYTGDIITFKHAPEGVMGDEKKDIRILPAPDMLLQKKRDEYFGKTFYGK